MQVGDTNIHLQAGKDVVTEPSVPDGGMTAKYEIITTTFYTIIHANHVGLTVMWDRGTRIIVKLQPSFQGKQDTN